MNVTWNLEMFSRLLTLVIFGFIGFGTSGKFPAPRNFLAWTLLVAATVLSLFILPQVELIGIDSAGFYVNTLLAGTGLGLIIGFLVKRRGNPVSTPGVAGQR
jgi:hypothetical protein